MIALPFVILSAAIHLILGYGFSRFPPPNLPQNPDAVEISVVEQNPSKKLQAVRLGLIPPSMRIPPPPSKDRARFLAENEQWVKKEMRSRNIGMTVNGNTDRIVPPQNNRRGDSQSEAKQDSDENENGVPKRKTLSELGQDLLVTSQSSDNLPDISDGPVTALNAERFIYGSFFSRVHDRFYPLWTRAFQDILNRMPLSEQTRIAGKQWRTEVEIIIDSEGRFQEAIIMRSSGAKSLDQAPVTAFREADFFPNPPSGMVQADGKVHLKWSFTHVVDDAHSWARRSSP